MKKALTSSILTIAALALIPALAEASTPLSSLGSATATNTFDNGNYEQQWTWNSLSGTGLLLTSSATSAANLQQVLAVTTTGANTASNVATYGGAFASIHSGTGSTNVALVGTAYNGSTNYGLYGQVYSSNAGDAGVVGIGTASIGATYGVYGGNASSTGYAGYFDNTGGGYAAAFMGGNVGIGTTTQSNLLTIGSNSSSLQGMTSADALVKVAGWSGLYEIWTTGISGRTNWGLGREYAYGGDLGFLRSSVADGTPDTTVLYMTGSGNVGIGNTTPAYLLHVGSGGISGAVAEFQNSSGDCTFTPSAGTLGISCSSDARLKSGIVDSGSALTWLADMHVRNYTIKSTGEKQTGVIAQEILPNHPDMVRANAQGTYLVEQPNPWKLVKAIQELKSDNDNLKEQLTRDEATIAAMKTKLQM